MHVFLANTFFYPAVGGIENYLLHIGRVLLKNGHKVTVCAKRHLPHLSHRDNVEGMNVIRFDHIERRPPFNIFNTLNLHKVFASACKKIGQENKFDLIIVRDLPALHAGIRISSVNTPIYYIQPAAYPLAMRLCWSATSKRPIARVFQNMEYYINCNWAGWLERRLLLRCAARIVLSCAKKYEISNYYNLPAGLFHVIPPGVNTSNYYPRNSEDRASFRSKHGLGSNTKIILYVGRFSREKNPKGAVRAFARMKNTREVVLLMVGPASCEFRDWAYNEAKGLNIIFAGEHVDPSLFFGVSDILLIPSLTEGFGQVIIEAMASALPCVAYANPENTYLLATNEVIRHGKDGILVEYGNEASLAATLDSIVYDNINLMRMSKYARDKAINTYDWAVTLENILSINGK